MLEPNGHEKKARRYVYTHTYAYSNTHMYKHKCAHEEAHADMYQHRHAKASASGALTTSCRSKAGTQIGNKNRGTSLIPT